MSIKQIDGYKIYLNKKLGQGSYGAVYIGISDNTHENVAVKILKKSDIDSDDYLKSALFSEIKIMQSVKSQNIVGFLDVMESSSNYYIVQELCDGDLTSIMKRGNTIPEPQAKQYLLQIVNGFLGLVREGIIHRDLKPANIMRKGNKLKIGDFGFAKKTQHMSTVKNQTIVGTPLYMSLEILKSESYSSKCDIWALGFIYYQMLHGYTPWIGKSQYDLIKKIETKKLEIDPNLSEVTQDFLKRCLAIHERDRICWDEVFAHPIFKGYFLNQSDSNQQFENKLKTVMSDLRFQINSNNLDLFKILSGLGYTDDKDELNRQQFYQFMKVISPSITRQESEYIFQKTDTDKNHMISIGQITHIMGEHSISLTSMYKHIPKYQKKQTINAKDPIEMSKMSMQTEQKVKKCFYKLWGYLRNSNRMLYDIFNQFDKSKTNSLNRQEFTIMLKKLSSDIEDDEAEAAFDLIDEDKSNSIEFQELNNYFSKVNGIPKHINRPSGMLENSANINGAHLFQNMFNYGNPQYHPSQQMHGPPMGYPHYQNPQMGMYYPQHGYGYQSPPPQQQPPQQGNSFRNLFANILGNNSSKQSGGW